MKFTKEFTVKKDTVGKNLVVNVKSRELYLSDSAQNGRDTFIIEMEGSYTLDQLSDALFIYDEMKRFALELNSNGEFLQSVLYAHKTAYARLA